MRKKKIPLTILVTLPARSSEPHAIKMAPFNDEPWRPAGSVMKLITHARARRTSLIRVSLNRFNFGTSEQARNCMRKFMRANGQNLERGSNDFRAGVYH